MRSIPDRAGPKDHIEACESSGTSPPAAPDRAALEAAARAFAKALRAAPDDAARDALRQHVWDLLAKADDAAGARIELVPFDTIEAQPGGGREAKP